MTRRLEVRCCCDPAKLLGSVPIPDSVDVCVGSVVTFVTTRAGWRLDPATGRPDHIPAEQLRLEIALWEHWVEFGDHRSGLALRSDDTLLERLQQIPGWEDAPT
jgi:hypothetical protein